LFTRDLGRILELVVRASAPLPSVAQIFFYTLPLALTYTIPMSVLVGILIGLSRLAADSEITAMRASGMGVWSFGRVLAIFVVAAWMLALFNGLYLAPWSMASLGRLEDQLTGSQVSFEVQPRVFYEGFPNACSTCRTCTPRRAPLFGKAYFSPTSPIRPIRALRWLTRHRRPEGQDRLHLHLIDGSTHETDPKVADHYQISTFQQTDIPIELPATENKSDEQIPVGVISTGELRDHARRVDPISARWYLIEFTAASHCLRPVWCSPWSGFLWDFLRRKAESQEVRPHDCSGFCLLLRLPPRGVAGAAGEGRSDARSVAGQYRFLRRGCNPTVASRTPAIALSAFRLGGKRDPHAAAKSPHSAWDAETAPTPSSVLPRAAAYSAPVFLPCSTITCCAISLSIWG